MLKIKKGDTVQVIKGKDVGRKGKVIKVFIPKGKALVEGINLAKKHKRKTTQDQQGGIVSIEMPIAISNLEFFCSHCARGVRVGFRVSSDGKKARFCKACEEEV